MNMADNESDQRELGRCVECGAVFAVKVTNDGDAVPIGTDGSCSCGNPVFEVVESDDVETDGVESGDVGAGFRERAAADRSTDGT